MSPSPALVLLLALTVAVVRPVASAAQDVPVALRASPAAPAATSSPHEVVPVALRASPAAPAATSSTHEMATAALAVPRASPPRATAAPRTVATAAADANTLHSAFDALLAAHVRAGRVDYHGLMGDRAALRAYLLSLAEVEADRLDRPAALALWINAYNAATLELILDHHGTIRSIKDIPSGERWKAVRWRVAGRTVSLDAIEHEILRPLGDARIHFAIVCASRSCPDLRSEAFDPARLDAQLDDATRRFLADPAKGLATATTRGFFGGVDHELRLSRIFDWFEEDFERGDGDVVDFVLAHAPAQAAAFIRAHRDDLEREHLAYDWSLNDDPQRAATPPAEEG